MERHCSNALTVAKYLEWSDKVEWVDYPDLESSKYHALAQKYMPHGTSGVISFGVKGGREGAARFMEGLKLASIVTHVADLRTCVLHPASTTHRQLTDQQLADAGISPNMIRMSVGIENINDILDDVKSAMSGV
jgi:O-acetylhomoserine (thiol)-lyase